MKGAVCGLIVAAMFMTQSACSAASDRPNILFILASRDQQRRFLSLAST